jgi:hypothetical protein
MDGESRSFARIAENSISSLPKKPFANYATPSRLKRRRFIFKRGNDPCVHPPTHGAGMLVR